MCLKNKQRERTKTIDFLFFSYVKKLRILKLSGARLWIGYLKSRNFALRALGRHFVFLDATISEF